MELMTQIVLKMLDWPFLFAMVFIFGLGQFRNEIQQLLTRGRISLMWGDKSFEISDLPEELDENFAPLSDDIEELKQRIADLEAQLEGARVGPPGFDDEDMAVTTAMPRSGPPESEPEPEVSDAKGLMMKALTDGQYTWRSIERLASVAGVSDQEAESMLRSLDEVQFSRQRKTGRVIVRLR